MQSISIHTFAHPIAVNLLSHLPYSHFLLSLLLCVCRCVFYLGTISESYYQI